MFNIHTVTLVRPRFGSLLPWFAPNVINAETIGRILYKFLALTAVVLFTGLAPSKLFADELNVPALTPRAQKVLAQAAKTPEEVFMLIKTLIDHPNTDAYDFVEKLSGIDRSYWKVSHTGKGIYLSPKDDGVKWTAFDFSSTQRLLWHERPYWCNLSYIIDKLNLLKHISVNFRAKSFPITAGDVRKALGMGEIVAYRPSGSRYVSNYYLVAYSYSTEKYAIAFRFKRKTYLPPNFKDIKDKKKRKEIFREIRDRITAFEGHKDFLLTGIQIKREKI